MPTKTDTKAASDLAEDQNLEDYDDVNNEEYETVDDSQELINVKSTMPQKKDKSYPIALFEKDERHPNGEAFVADDKVHLVAKTNKVQEALKAGKLKQVQKKATK